MLSRHMKPGGEKCKDSGLALVLICLICYQVWKLPSLILAAIIVLLLAMSCPRVFQPFAICWFALSDLLGTIVSKLILTLLFIGLVLPIGLLRRTLGKDSMCLKCWQDGDQSVFRSRQQKFVAKDLEHPY